MSPRKTAPLLDAVLAMACLAAPLAAQDHFVLSSDTLDEDRDVWVQMPAHDGFGGAYPVLYVFDAEWVFAYAAGVVDFLSGEVGARIPPLIVVGVPNTDRDRDLTWNDGATPDFEAFMDFVEHELVPEIDARYPTLDHRAVYGWSSASNVPLWAAFERPGLFRTHIASGSGIGTTGDRVARAILGDWEGEGVRLSVSTEGTTPQRVVGLERLTRLLEEMAPESLDWSTSVMAGADHAEVLATGLEAGLVEVYADWALPEEVALGGPEEVRRYYGALADEYGFAPGWPEYPVGERAYQMLYGGHEDAAVALLEAHVEVHRSSAVARRLLDEAYAVTGRTPRSVERRYCTEYGPMIIRFDPDKVAGVFAILRNADLGSFVASLEGRIATGTWTELDSGGRIRLTFSDDWTRLEAAYTVRTDPDRWLGDWTGVLEERAGDDRVCR